MLQQFLISLRLWKSSLYSLPLLYSIHRVFPRSTCEMSRLSFHAPSSYLRSANSWDGLTMTTPFMPLASCRVQTYR